MNEKDSMNINTGIFDRFINKDMRKYTGIFSS